MVLSLIMTGFASHNLGGGGCEGGQENLNFISFLVLKPHWL